MQIIVDGKIFDTENAKEIIKYRRTEQEPNGLGLRIGTNLIYYNTYFDCTLYKTNKGSYIEYKVGVKGTSSKYSKVLSKEEVKEILMELNEKEIYEQEFEELEEW